MRVVTNFVRMQLEIMKVDDICCDCVEELAVVRYNHQRLFPPLKIFFKP